jgi:hypothetical protein
MTLLLCGDSNRSVRDNERSALSERPTKEAGNMELMQQGKALKRALPLLLAPTFSTDLEDTSFNCHQIKASFLFNLLRFIEWPTDVFARDNRLNLTICGSYSLDAFRALHGARVGDRTISVQRIKQKELVAGTINKCHVLFISGDVPVLSIPIARGMLTVGETEGFTACGGIINLLMIDWRMRFQINQEMALACSLVMDPRLSNISMR